MDLYICVQPLIFGNAPEDEVIGFETHSVRHLTTSSWNCMTVVTILVKNAIYFLYVKLTELHNKFK